MEYAVYYSGCCDEHGGPDLTYFETLEEAEKYASKGETIFKVVKEVE